jgi:DNA invertase Pin-like site-specific DNA recombinase
MTVFGYARVSTRGQTLDAQLATLAQSGCLRVFCEKISGIDAKRPQLQEALQSLQTGDVLMVTRLDRLARSSRDLLNIVATLAERGVGFRSLADGWADTTTPHGRLLLTVLGGLAEFERELIRNRTSEGRQRALARGVRFGRPPKLSASDRLRAVSRVASGENPRHVAASYNVSYTTIWRLRERR